MRPALLRLDDALGPQTTLAERCGAADGVDLDARQLGPQLRLWSRPHALDAMRDRLDDGLPHGAEPVLTFFGSGDFHHVSALLIARVLRQKSQLITVVHIDNHPDWVKFGDGLHCGSWAAKAARMPGVDRVVTLGVCSADIRQPWRKRADLTLVRKGRIVLFAHGHQHDDTPVTVAGIARPTMAGMGQDGFIDHLLTKIRTQDVYLSVDKDALGPQDAATNWDQGRMRLAYLSRLIARIGAKHRIVGADVCGDRSEPVYGGPIGTRLLKRGEAWIDQPRGSAPVGGDALNEHANLALLDDIMAAAA